MRKQYIKLMLAAIAAVTLAGTAAAAETYTETVCGNKVTFHPDSLAACKPGMQGCTLRSGDKAYDIFYSTRDPGVLEHEKEHACGLLHKEPWKRVGFVLCTKVVEGGTTEWKPGDVMCRMDSGPPVKMNHDSRVRAALE